jgi:hypothetical protein
MDIDADEHAKIRKWSSKWKCGLNHALPASILSPSLLIKHRPNGIVRGGAGRYSGVGPTGDVERPCLRSS